MAYSFAAGAITAGSEFAITRLKVIEDATREYLPNFGDYQYIQGPMLIILAVFPASLAHALLTAVMALRLGGMEYRPGSLA